MSQTGNREIYYAVLAREIERQRRMLNDPSFFLEELEGYITEGNDEILRNILADEIHLRRIWGGILLLASQLRKKDSSLWGQCEPVIRCFWERVAPFTFREGDPLSQLLKERLHADIFGEQEER